ncbi:MAG: Bifunctional purine biosynthesis protein PurH [Chlamydiae bacterium]|nr:Bifunctional purine biosynthesis protein PurH [Chlamydiota bacterium]
MKKVSTVLMSVTDKTGLVEFATQLKTVNPDLTIIASGGTAKTLKEARIDTLSISDYTNYPECFGGRVKTLHPMIAGGILFRRGLHDDEAKKLGIKPIDMVVCNLYDFEAAIGEGLEIDKLIEYLDIGGSTLIRAAVKNYTGVVVVVDPHDYPTIIDEMEVDGSVCLETRENLAVKAINLSADYEALLAEDFTERLKDEKTCRPLLVQGEKLRYGENPDQEAWVYKFHDQQGIAQADVLSGKKLSYNNYEDATIAYNAAQNLCNLTPFPGIAIIKHGGICGYATGTNLPRAFQLAWEGDIKSAFGSVIAINNPVTIELVPELEKKFIEVIIAPSFSDEFIEWAKETTPNLRLLRVPNGHKGKLIYKNISGGMLIQTNKDNFYPSGEDMFVHKMGNYGVVTKQKPPSSQHGLFQFAVTAVNFAKSNTIAIAREVKPNEYQLIGIGAGQPNRVDCLQLLAIPRAIENLKRENQGKENYDPREDLSKCVLASDGFFPFDDSIRYAAEMGLKYCIQPGGSKRDQTVIDAADECGICMIFTGIRNFSH